MLDKLADSFTAFILKAANRNKPIQVFICLAVVFPVFLIAAYEYSRTYQDLTESALSRRQSLAALASTALEQRLNRLTDLGVSFATRVRFRQFVSEKKWGEAIHILDGVRKDFPVIDRIFLADGNGTLMADVPALPE